MLSPNPFTVHHCSPWMYVMQCLSIRVHSYALTVETNRQVQVLLTLLCSGLVLCPVCLALRKVATPPRQWDTGRLSSI